MTNMAAPKAPQPVAPVSPVLAAVRTKIATVIYKLIPVILVVIVALIVWYYLNQSHSNPKYTANARFKQLIYTQEKDYLKENGETAEDIAQYGVRALWLRLSLDKRVKGTEKILDETRNQDSAFAGSDQERLLKLQLANHYRDWANAPDANAKDALERLNKSDEQYQAVIGGMSAKEMMYFQVVLAHARVKLDIATATEGQADKKQKFQEAADYIQDQLAKPTDRKIAEEIRLRVLRGIALGRLCELYGGADAKLKEEAVTELDMSGDLPHPSIERDVADDIIRRLEGLTAFKGETAGVKIAGRIEDAIETINGEKVLSAPELPVMDEFLRLWTMPPLPELPPPPPEPAPVPAPAPAPEGGVGNAPTPAPEPVNAVPAPNPPTVPVENK